MEFKEIVSELGSELKKESLDRKRLADLINGSISSYNQVVNTLKSLSQSQGQGQTDDKLEQLRKDLEKGEKKYKKKVIDLQTIFEIAKELTSSLDIDHLMKSIVLTTMGHLLVESAALFVLEDGSGRYILRSAKGFKNDLSQFIFKPEEELVSKAAQTGKPEPASSFASSESVLKSMNCELVVPVMSKSTLVGLLLLGPKAGSMPYSEANLDFLSALGNFAAIAIENAKLYMKLESRNCFHNRCLTCGFALSWNVCFPFGCLFRGKRTSSLINITLRSWPPLLRCIKRCFVFRNGFELLCSRCRFSSG